MKNTNARRLGSIVLAGALASSFVAAPLSTAFAATSAELNAQADATAAERKSLEAQVAEAQARLETLYAEAEGCQNDLITTQVNISNTEKHITELETEIEELSGRIGLLQEDLSDIISSNYKNGRPTLLNIVLESKSFDELISRITYANKVTEHENNVIGEVRTLQAQQIEAKTTREQELDSLKSLETEQTERLAASKAAAAEVEGYRSQLSAEVSQKIAEEEAARQQAAQAAAAEAAEAARIRAEQEAAAAAAAQAAAAAAAQAEAQAAPSAPAESSPAPSAPVSAPSDSGSASSGSWGGGSRSESSSGSSSGGSYSVDEDDYSYDDSDDDDYGYSAPVYSGGSGMVARAYSIIGSGYSYSGYNWTGSTSSSWFTCSGVVDFALGLPSHSNSPETLYAAVGSNMKYDISQLNYGDLVFFPYAGRYPGHVGIYIGGGQMIDASPGTGVSIRTVGSSFMGGGPL